uniref:Flavone synthase II-2 n=1 Tax=Scutellaria baicalensis TaxID=65409 RepID=A0A146AUJ9_SCUBA|nr:flavone synthase II-2 [Scutellaria baicalensis]
MEVTLNVALLLLSAAVCLMVFTGKRRRRLPNPPGPFPLPLIGNLNLVSPRLHHTFHMLAQRYGPIMKFRLGSIPCLVVSTPELAKDILKTHELIFSSRVKSTAIDIVTYGVSFAFSPYGPYWKYIKKLCTYELLGSRMLNHFEPLRALEVREFLKDVMAMGKAGKSFNVTEELMKLTSNVMSNMMLSIRAAESEEQAEVARTLIREVSQLFGEFDFGDMLWFCKSFDFQGIKKRSKDIKVRYDALLEKILTDRENVRRQNGVVEPKDMLDMFLDIMEGGKTDVEFTREHLKAVILDFLTAGTDTTAITVEWVLAELMNSPKAMKKAQDEMDRVVGRERMMAESDAPNLPYFLAIIKETFRLHPPIPLIIRRSIEDCVIDGYHIPADTLAFINVWSMGRNEKYWDSPLSFRPERFLEGDNAAIDIKGMHFELLPFGSGRRGCPGMLSAIQEVLIIAGTVIQCFDWEQADGSGRVDMSERPGLTTPREIDLVCRVVPRVDERVISGH